MDILKSIPLRLKAAAVVGGGLIVLLAVLLAVLSVVLTRNFAHIQENRADQQIARIIRQLDASARTMLTNVADEATWDETYDFVHGRGADYLTRNYYDDPDYEEAYNIVLVYDADRKFLGGVTLDENGFRPALPPNFDTSALAETTLIGGGEGVAGIVSTSPGPILAASWPIRTTDGESDIAGTLVYGQFLEHSVLPRLSQATEKDVRIVDSAPGRDFRAESSIHLDSEFFGTVTVHYDTPGSEWLKAKSMAAELALPTLENGSVTIAAHIPAEIFQQAIESRNVIFATVSIGGILWVALALALIEMQVLRRLRSVDEEFERLSREPEPGDRVIVRGTDEFGRLGASANRMLDHLETSRRRLADEHELLAGVLNTISEGVLATQAERDAANHILDFRILRTNAAAAQLLQSSENALADQPLSKVLTPILGIDHWHHLLHSAAIGVPYRSEVTALDRGFAFTAEVWKDGLVITISDITARKEAEKQQQLALEEVERFNSAMLGREERILELKSEVNELSMELKRPPRYGLGLHTP